MNEEDRAIEKGKKRKINAKKLSRTAAALCFLAAAAIIAVYFIEKNGGAGAIAAAAVPVAQDTQTGSLDPALSGRIIVVDAGHGGEDPGAAGVSGVFESELNLRVAALLKRRLEEAGAKVVMTREDENALADTKAADMAKRKDIIAGSGADIAVSVHMNYFGDPSVSGPVVLFMYGSAEGEKLAGAVMESLNAELAPKVPGTARYEKDIFILKCGAQPSILVECGYLSNPEEEGKLKDADYQDRIAKAVCAGITAYFEQQRGG